MYLVTVIMRTLRLRDPETYLLGRTSRPDDPRSRPATPMFWLSSNTSHGCGAVRVSRCPVVNR